MTTTAPAADRTSDLTHADRLRRLNRLRSVARVMDTAIRIPGTNFRFGADSILGLIPVAGDAGGAAIGLIIVNEARKLGLPKRKLFKMMRNLGADALVGSVPLVGDVFDVFFKAHRRNVPHRPLDEGHHPPALIFRRFCDRVTVIAIAEGLSCWTMRDATAPPPEPSTGSSPFSSSSCGRSGR